MKTTKLLFIALGVIAFYSCKKPPVPNLTASATEVQVGEPVIFTDGDAERKNTTIQYDYGDGTSSEFNERNPSHVYNRPGTYTVSQNVMSNKNAERGKGMYASATVTVTVKGATAAFTPSSSSPKVGETVTFTDATTDGDKGYALQYNWWMVSSTGGTVSLGAGNSATYTFDANDTWTVYLEVYQGWEHKSSTSSVITVGTGSSNNATYNKMIAKWTFVSDVTVTTIANSTGGFGCPTNGTNSVNSNTNAVSVTFDADGNMWVIRTTGDQVTGSAEGTVTIISNTIADISGFTFGDTYTIKTLSSASLVLEAKNIQNQSCSAVVTTVRTLTLSK